MENCPVCDSIIDETNDSVELDCEHKVCRACLTIFKEQGQVCPASSHCQAVSLTLILADGSRETKAMALDRKRREADEIDEKMLAIDLRLTLESDHADLLLQRAIRNAKDHKERQVRDLYQKVTRRIIRLINERTEDDDRWPTYEIRNKDDQLIKHIIHKVSPYVELSTDYYPTIKKAAKALGGLTPLQELLLAKAESAHFVNKRSYVSPEEYLVDFEDYQLRWTDEKGWEIGEFPLPNPRYTFMFSSYRCTYEVGVGAKVLNYLPDTAREERECAKARKKHKETMDAAIAKHKAEIEKLCFELKCLETDIEALEVSTNSTASSSSSALYAPKEVKQLEFGEAKIHKHYAGYLDNVGMWLFNVPRYNMIPLTHKVVMLHGSWCTVLHTCKMLNKRRVRGKKVVEISSFDITRGYVVGDVFWFCEKSEHEEEWKGVSIQTATLGKPIKGDRPPEPIYPATTKYNDSMLTVRHDSTREMLWVGLLPASGKAHILGALPY